MRYIDADALIEKAHEIEDSGDTWSIESADEFEWALDDYAPTIEPKRGEWIEQEDCWQCSECGDEYVLEVDVKPIDAKMHFCPNCGAKMKGADDE